MNTVVQYYEKMDEDTRLTSNKARRVEFITTVEVLDRYIPQDARILDVAAGTGIYTFYYAEKGHDVFAADITPKHIDIIQDKMKAHSKPLKLQSAVNDATDLSMFNQGQYDVVLCLGPIYHLLDQGDRKKCISECLRVLKSGGILAIAYVNKHYIFPHIVTRDKRFLKESIMKRVVLDSCTSASDEDCYWTDAYYSTPEEIEQLLEEFEVERIDHVATDGLSPLLRDTVDSMNDEEYRVWIDYHMMTCREKSIMGISNHGLLICRKL